MLEGVFGNKSAERVLLYIENYGEGYGKEIARTFEMALFSVQRQLQRLEHAGVLSSQLKGGTRIYMWNPRFAFKSELGSLLRKALSLMPESDTKRFFRKRTRPRRVGKP